jgi:hypothetical protein
MRLDCKPPSLACSLLACLGACALPQPWAAPTEGPHAAEHPRIVNAQVGSQTAAGYDQAREAEIAAVNALSKSDFAAAHEHLLRAEAKASDTLDIVANLQGTQRWVDGLLYETQHDGILDETQILAGLRRIHDDAHVARLSLGGTIPVPDPEPDESWDEQPRISDPAAVADAAEPQPERQPKPEQGPALYVATTFAAGQCLFNDCTKNGWTVRADDGTHETRCNFGNCFTDGWTTSHPGGTTSRTSCRFGKCTTDGWTTSHPDGRSSNTTCAFGKCFEDGWRTSYPDGSSSETRCNFGKCATDGWTTRFPDGSSTRCTCRFNDCLENGASCG